MREASSSVQSETLSPISEELPYVRAFSYREWRGTRGRAPTVLIPLSYSALAKNLISLLTDFASKQAYLLKRPR
jgi:hypothetical protein